MECALWTRRIQSLFQPAKWRSSVGSNVGCSVKLRSHLDLVLICRTFGIFNPSFLYTFTEMCLQLRHRYTTNIYIPYGHNAQPFHLLVLIDQNFLKLSRNCSVILSVTSRRITAVFETIKKEESLFCGNWQAITSPQWGEKRKEYQISYITQHTHTKPHN